MKIAKNYDDINWQQCRKELFRLQFEVLKAYRTNDKEKFNKIQQAQHSLTRSFAARCLAVRKDTPGIDKVVYKTKKEKFDIIKEIKDLSHYKAQPVRRVYISKSNNKLRPLGIPTMKDRIVQTLFHFAIDPIVEETTDSRSYGFRLYKGVNDNMTYLKLVLGSYTATRRYVLDADIENFFPSVCHKWLLNNVPINKRILKEFLKAGVMDKRRLYPTNEGFPQGSPISPSLANLALNNLQESIGKEFLSTRYADDFIVLGKNKKELEEIALPRIKKFLEVRGLKLSLEKTYITDISKGFDFLGYNFREYSDKNRIKGTKQGIFLVKPSHKKVKDFKRDLSLTVRKYRKASMYLLIQTLNQKLRGWSEHYRTVTSQKMFSSISYHLWQICWKMLRKRHRRRPAKYLIEKYFTKVDGNKWIFRCEHSNKKDELTLFQIPYVPLKRHLIVKNINPYDLENYEYFEKRIASSSRHSVLLIRAKGKLLQNQKGICSICKNYLLNGENLDVHHIKSRKDGGSDNTSNLLLLHNECHKQVTYSKNKDFKAIWLKEGIIK